MSAIEWTDETRVSPGSGVMRGNHWKGGRTISSQGYVLVWVGRDHHLADCRGYAYEHRLVAEQKLGRRLGPGEQVHHLNEDKADNRSENIEIVPSRLAHGERHRRRSSGRRRYGEPNPVVSCACRCGETFPKFDRSGRPRRFVSGHNGRFGALTGRG